jgi:competence protein ComEA
MQDKNIRTLVQGLILSLLPAGAALAGPVNLNSADAATLARELDGIGPAKAQAIVEFRQKNGPFRSPDDLLQAITEGARAESRHIRLNVGGAAPDRGSRLGEPRWLSREARSGRPTEPRFRRVIAAALSSIMSSAGATARDQHEDQTVQFRPAPVPAGTKAGPKELLIVDKPIQYAEEAWVRRQCWCSSRARPGRSKTISTRIMSSSRNFAQAAELLNRASIVPSYASCIFIRALHFHTAPVRPQSATSHWSTADD